MYGRCSEHQQGYVKTEHRPSPDPSQVQWPQHKHTSLFTQMCGGELWRIMTLYNLKPEENSASLYELNSLYVPPDFENILWKSQHKFHVNARLLSEALLLTPPQSLMVQTRCVLPSKRGQVWVCESIKMTCKANDLKAYTWKGN